MFLEDLGKGLEDLGRSLEVKTEGSNPKTSKTRISLFTLKFPYFPFWGAARCAPLHSETRETRGKSLKIVYL